MNRISTQALLWTFALIACLALQAPPAPTVLATIVAATYALASASRAMANTLEAASLRLLGVVPLLALVFAVALLGSANLTGWAAALFQDAVRSVGGIAVVASAAIGLMAVGAGVACLKRR